MFRQSLGRVHKYELLVVPLVLAGTYFLIVLSFGYLQHLHDTMFWTVDSNSYKAVADWIWGLENTKFTLIRPLFYPLMLGLSRNLAGIFGIWSYQFTLWLISGLLLYRSINIATNNIFLSVGGVLIFTGNLTLMLLTLHALTEVTVIFLLTVLIILIINKRRHKATQYWFWIIFVVSLLTITKPVFSLLLLPVLIYRIPFFILELKDQGHRLRFLTYLFLALSPVLIQLSLMKVKHDEFSISQIGPRTAANYYLPRVFRDVNHISLAEARKHTKDFDRKEIFEYLLTHHQSSLRTYLITLKENVAAESNFINRPDTHSRLFRYMKLTNEGYLFLHILMLPPSILVLMTLFKRRNWADLEMVIFLMYSGLIIVLTSGITFSQGDRIVLPSLPLWIVLYSIILSIPWRSGIFNPP